MPRIVYEFSTSGGVEVSRLFDNIALGAKRAKQEAERSVTGTDIERMWAGVGKAAETNLRKLDSESRRAAIGMRVVNSSIGEMKTAAHEALHSLGPMGSVLGSLGTSGIAGAAVLGIGAVAGALLHGAHQAADFAKELDDQSKRIGVNVESLQEYKYVADQAGVSQEGLQKSLQIFVRTIGGAQLGSDKLAKGLGELDQGFVDTVKSAGSTEQRLDLVIHKIASLTDVSEQARVAQLFFGKSAAELLPLFQLGAEGIDKMRERAKELGIVLSEDLVAGGTEAKEALSEMSMTITRNLQAALLGLAPALTTAAEGISEFVADVGKSIDQMFELSIGAKIENLRSQMRELEGLTFAPGGLPAAGVVEQLQKKIDQLEAERGLATDARRAQRKQSDVAAAKVEAGREAASSMEALEKAAPEEEDKLKKLGQLRIDALNDQVNLRKLDLQDEETFRKNTLAIEERYIAAVGKLQEADTNKEDTERRKREAAAEKEAKRKRDLAGLVAEARRDAASAGLEGEAKIRQEAENDVQRATERIKELAATEIEFTDQVAAFRTERMAQADRDVAKFRKDEADKLWKKQQEIDVAQQKEDEKTAEDVRKAEEKAAIETAEATAKAREAAMKPVENTLRNIQEDLGNALVGVFTQGEEAAKSFEQTAIDMVKNIAAELAQMTLSQAVVDPLLKKLGGLIGPSGPRAIPGVTSLPEGVQGPVMTEAAAGERMGGGLASSLAGMAALAAALGIAGQQMGASRASFDKATLNTGQAAKNMLTGTQAVIVAGATAAGAAIGAAAFGVGALPGAAVGAAVGTVISKELEKSVVGGITSGVKKGLDQPGLFKEVQGKLSDNLLINVAAPLLTSNFPQFLAGGLGPVLLKMLIPDIEQIFQKMFRQVLGGTGGLSTDVAPAYGAGAKVGIAGDVTQASRLIAQLIGAGGTAYGPERAAGFQSILAGGVMAEAKKTGKDAGVVLAEAFVGAFQGSFLDAAKVALQTPDTYKRGLDFKFIAKEFGQGTRNFDFDYDQLGAIIQREGNIPQGKARKQSREAFAKGLDAAFADAADSNAFRKSLANSVQQAFAQQGAQALNKAFGDTFASFFSVGRENRRELRKAKRRGDAETTIDILSKEFEEGVADFAKFVSQPAFATGIQKLTDEFLRLQVAMALTSDGTSAAADVIMGELAPAIQTLKDAIQLGRDVRSRTAIALAGPGFAGDQANVAALRAQREDIERDFNARFGKLAFFPDTGGLFGAKLGDQATGTHITKLGPEELLGPLREFADARLAELEAEIALQRQLEEQFKALAVAFEGLSDQIKVALGTMSSTQTLDKQVADAQEKYAAALADGFKDPALVQELQQSLGTAIGTAISQMDAFKQLREQSEALGRTIDEALGLRDAGTRIKELFAELNAGIEQTPEALTKALGSVQEAVQLVSGRRDLYQGAADEFGQFADTAMVARRGKRGQRDLLGKRRAEIAQLMSTVRAGGPGSEEALSDLRRLLPEALSLGQSALSGGRFRAFAAEMERAGIDLEAFSKGQVDVANQQLAELAKLNKLIGGDATTGEDQAKSQLELLQVLADDAQLKAGTASADAKAAREKAEADLKAFRDQWLPIMDYLTSAAGSKLNSDLQRIADMLGDGPDGKLHAVLVEVRDRLPVITAGRAGGGPVSGGLSYLVGERGVPEVFTPSTAGTISQQGTQAAGPSVTIGQLSVSFQEPPSSQAQAREYGRIVGDAALEQIQQAVQRSSLRKVA